ncbi:MAG: hypothetical protein IPF54_13020 [Draconibacterium sp.]|nr:hypothetical protein [Draconibacterium sp.]
MINFLPGSKRSIKHNEQNSFSYHFRFSGSGKTTFLKRIIDKYSDEYKIGIIQNEFAPANIDGAELKKSGKDFNLLEINNGSVFCVCLLGDFVRSLEKFIDEIQPEILIIEASGLSDTTSVAEVISSGSLSEKIYLAPIGALPMLRISEKSD